MSDRGQHAQVNLKHDPRSAATKFALDADLLDLMQESLIVIGLDDRIRRWNKASERIYGWSQAQAEGRLFCDVLGGDPRLASHELRRLASKGPSWREISRKTAFGEDVIVSTQLSVRHNASGEPIEIVETGIDLTGQRRAEVAADLGRRHYRNVFQAIPASVWDIDFSEARALALSWLETGSAGATQWLVEHPERVRQLMRATYVRDVNERALDLFGPCTRDQLLVDMERYWPDTSAADFMDWVASSLAGEPYFARETRLRTFSGREFDALFTASYAPGTIEQGQLVITIVDYSDVRRNQAAVRESEAFYTDLFHGSAFSAWHLDATKTQILYAGLREQGVGDFDSYAEAHPEIITELMEAITVVDVNETTLRLFGASHRDEIVGKTITQFWLPENLQAITSSLKASFYGEPSVRTLTQMRTLSGDAIDVLYTRSASSTLRSAGQLLLAIVDMTDKVQAQNALAEMQATFAHAARVSSLGELTASIAHEVNQPLAAITANGEAALLRLEQPNPDLDRLRGLTEEMISDARRASDVVAHVRSMASPQAGSYRRLSMSLLVEDALTLLGSQLSKCGMVVTRDLKADLPEVMGDAIQLQQVVVNLVLNALHAMAGSHCPRLLIGTAAIGDELAITIDDNGTGIAPENLERLFTSFFTTKSDGMGIGLAICRTIVEAHGGAIAAQNLEGGGARFTVRLPPALMT
jgi:PAS domain S-box-containing protein